MAFDQNAFNEFVIENKVVGVFENRIKLKSGRDSNWYANWRTPVEDAYLTDILTDHVIDFTVDQGLNPESFYGVPEGATKLGIIAQFKWAKSRADYAKGAYPLPMGRGKPKEHGAVKDKYFVGLPRGKTLVLEDVTTTGGSALETVSNLKELGVEIIGAIGLTNRMELTPIPGVDSLEVVKKFSGIYERATGNAYQSGISVEQAFADAGVKYYAMSRATELLPVIARRQNIARKLLDEIAEEFNSVGISKISFA